MAPSYTTDLFVPGDLENKALGAVVTVADRLVNTFVIVTRDNVGVTACCECIRSGCRMT